MCISVYSVHNVCNVVMSNIVYTLKASEPFKQRYYSCFLFLFQLQDSILTAKYGEYFIIGENSVPATNLKCQMATWLSIKREKVKS